jgi:hypothetical protein
MAPIARSFAAEEVTWRMGVAHLRTARRLIFAALSSRAGTLCRVASDALARNGLLGASTVASNTATRFYGFTQRRCDAVISGGNPLVKGSKT